ncbi:MAG: PIG-L family deacetylase [Acidobacteriaceae bacterium]
MLRLLCVTAHPDDESGGFGGTLLYYAERGVATHVLCLTDGQAASNRGNSRGGAELGAMRRQEFAAACAILQVQWSEIIGLPDGQLDRQPFADVVGHIVRRIREIKPHIMLTFGTEGAVTAHPDHSMASLFATAAFHWAGRSNRYQSQIEAGLQPWRVQKLYYETLNFTLPGRQPVSPAPWTVLIEIGQERLLKKRDAFAAHTTQNPLLPLFEGALKARPPRELFHLANTVHQMPARQEADLFEGVVEE